MKQTRIVGLAALTVLMSIGCGGRTGFGPRLTADNVVEVTLEQAARVLSDLGAVVDERTASLVAAFEELPECPVQREQLFELGALGLGGRRPVDPVDDRAWRDYRSLLASCRSDRSHVSLWIEPGVGSIRRVYGADYVERSLAFMRERITVERLERNNVSLESLADADLQARWDVLHYVVYQRAYGIRGPGGLDPGSWPDLDERSVERRLDYLAEEFDNRVFDVRDFAADATALYERMVKGEHR